MKAAKPIESIDRAIRIVDFIARNGEEGVSLTEIAGQLEINKATAHHALATLKFHGWVEQDLESSFYKLGWGMANISRYFASHTVLTDILHPILEKISAQINELVHLGTISGTDVLYLDKVEPDRSVRVVSHIGKRTPVATTALGAAILGSQSILPAKMELYLKNQPAERKQKFLSRCQKVAVQGWAIEEGENEEGIGCVAIPVLQHGIANMAISVTVPLDRLTESEQSKYLQAIADGIMSIPSEYGFHVPSQLNI